MFTPSPNKYVFYPSFQQESAHIHRRPQSALSSILDAEDEALVAGDGDAEFAKVLRQLLSEMDA